MAMKRPKKTTYLFFFFLSTLLFSTLLSNIPGIHAADKLNNVRRLMIGSMAPTCTYNECKGCRFRCKAEQVPVDANDPINSAYHYRCVCHG
ncbi:EPIDERMAL PATTERNING FACTOR-like protein 9 [Dioscorea cayenensis subsp. rotundata]|uniref:EPIDERMAL PATTERNING FACTOR-like protein 9 n=1 Tax=Dioscorea cayennensis subsp. rotundata TaxID=55577 RepID=A0AB40BFQ7_DIOCR|nr:EPIDERMAL PATTERNING FACTOR-like protein 9 [Dioscorea cayenensis subsp. rotundata]